MTRLSLVAVSALSLIGTLAYCDPEQNTKSSWHAIDGRSLAVGAISSVGESAVQIRKSDNSFVVIKLDTLSLADRALVLTSKKKVPEFETAIRRWTSSGGAHHVEAKALVASDQSVDLLKTDGKVVNVPLGRLSNDDRSYVKRLQLAGQLNAKEGNPFDASKDAFGSVEAFSGGAPKPDRDAKPNPQSTTKYKTVDGRLLTADEIWAERHHTTSSSTPTLGDRVTKSTGGLVDRNPYGETSTGSTATGIPTYTGPRGGTYHYSKSGNKVYSKKK